MKPAYSPHHYHAKITDAILSAYDNADFLEKVNLNKLTNPLIDRCPRMSREMAIEALGKCGIWLARNQIKSYSEIGGK